MCRMILFLGRGRGGEGERQKFVQRERPLCLRGLGEESRHFMYRNGTLINFSALHTPRILSSSDTVAANCIRTISTSLTFYLLSSPTLH
jgi:hypothetical protein